MVSHSSIIRAWEISSTEEPGGLQSMGLRVRHDLSMHTHTHKHSNAYGLELTK